MRKLITLGLLLALGFVLASCGGGPEAGGSLEVSEDAEEVVVIDHKNKALGGTAPAWVFASIADLEADAKYEGLYVFKVEADGKDKDGALTMLRGMEVPTMVARQVSTRVQNKFVGAQVGDKDTLETYMENVTKSLAVATITGMREQDNYWIKLQEGSDKYFRALLFVTVPREEIDSAIDRALEEENARTKPKSEDEEKARERVKDVFGSGME